MLRKMTPLINKSTDWPPSYYQTARTFPKSSAPSHSMNKLILNKPAITVFKTIWHDTIDSQSARSATDGHNNNNNNNNNNILFYFLSTWVTDKSQLLQECSYFTSDAVPLIFLCMCMLLKKGWSWDLISLSIVMVDQPTHLVINLGKNNKILIFTKQRIAFYAILSFNQHLII